MGKKRTFAAETMKVYQLIEQMIADGTWIKWCSVSEDAMNKNKQYSIYHLMLTLEPQRRYGYRKRLANHIAANGIKFMGGVLRKWTKIALITLLLVWSAMCLSSVIAIDTPNRLYRKDIGG